MITVAGFGDSQMSRKPGNIVLNWRRFFDVGPDVGVAGAGRGRQRGLCNTLIALYMSNKVWRGAEYLLDDGAASIIEATWRNGARARRHRADEAFALTNQLRRNRQLAALTRREVERSVNVLVNMRCIELKGGDIWLREWVRKGS